MKIQDWLGCITELVKIDTNLIRIGYSLYCKVGRKKLIQMASRITGGRGWGRTEFPYSVC